MKNTIVLLTLLAVSSSLLAQTSRYYITDGDAGRMFIVQNGAIQTTATTTPLDEGIAVLNTVRLIDYAEHGAHEYTLLGTPTGQSWTGTGTYHELLDGTTDGTYNYTIAWSYADPNPVLRYDLNWQNPTVLFYLPSGVNAMAITYDPSTSHLFIAFDHENTIREFTLAGSQVNSFATGLGLNRIAGLAYEPATDSLWFKDNGSAVIYNFSKSGTELGAITIPNLGSHNDWGGEFSMTAALPAQVPAASAWTLAALCLALATIGFIALRR